MFILKGKDFIITTENILFNFWNNGKIEFKNCISNELIQLIYDNKIQDIRIDNCKIEIKKEEEEVFIKCDKLNLDDLQKVCKKYVIKRKGGK